MFSYIDLIAKWSWTYFMFLGHLVSPFVNAFSRLLAYFNENVISMTVTLCLSWWLSQCSLGTHGLFKGFERLQICLFYSHSLISVWTFPEASGHVIVPRAECRSRTYYFLNESIDIFTFFSVLILNVITIDRCYSFKQKLFGILHNFSEFNGILKQKTIRTADLSHRKKKF